MKKYNDKNVNKGKEENRRKIEEKIIKSTRDGLIAISFEGGGEQSLNDDFAGYNLCGLTIPMH